MLLITKAKFFGKTENAPFLNKKTGMHPYLNKIIPLPFF